MSDKPKTRLSREEVAKIEIGHTAVSRPLQWLLTGFFLVFIVGYAVGQFFYRQPFAEWQSSGDVQRSIKAYESAIEESSLLRRWLLAPAQRFLTGVMRTGNEKVLVGRDGWLFFSGDCEYLFNPGFLEERRMRKRELSGVHPDPVAAILDFNRQLKARGVRLVLLPVPVKPMIYPDKLGGGAAPLQNPSFEEFKRRLEADGVTVVDLAKALSELRLSGVAPYLKTDTHWTPAGMELAADVLSEIVGANAATAAAEPVQKMSVTNSGDIAGMLELPDCDSFFPPETVEIRRCDAFFDTGAEILLLGDSFANIYSLAAMNWGDGGGLAEALGVRLGAPVDAILRNDSGAYATRQLLAHELKRGRDRLAGKKVVVWEFAARELVNGDWKLIDLTLAAPPAAEMIEVDEPRTVSATVLAVSPVPRPNSAPYKDHVMSLYLGDVDDSGDRALVYTVGMRDNEWTSAARLRPGDRVTVTLKPWADAEPEFGGWNRGEFEDEELLLAPPNWGELDEPRPERK